MTIAALVVAGPLKRGPLKLAAVFTLQAALVKLRDLTASPDGYFGPKTERAVQKFQASASLPQTGVADGPTALAMDKLLAVVTPPPVIQIPGDPPWFVIATSLLGIYELPGGRDNPIIVGWAKELGGMIAKEYKHDATPWCQLFVQHCLFKGAQPHLDSLWALDNANYGVRLSGPARGAIGTKKRNGGGHTFFIVGRSAPGKLVIRGGNQSDMVCDEDIDPIECNSVTWPKTYPLPLPGLTGFKALPLVKDAPRNRREA